MVSGGRIAWTAPGAISVLLASWSCRMAPAEESAVGEAFRETTRATEHSPAKRTVPLPVCLGTSLPLRLSGQLPYVEVAVGPAATARTGSFLVDFGTTGSAIDLGAFTPAAPVPTHCTSAEAGARRPSCEFSDFQFFGSWGRVSLYRDDFASVHGVHAQAGMIGTDFLSVHAFSLDYEGAQILSARTPSFCSDVELRTAGFVALSTAGFYAKDRSKLRPLADVVALADGGTSSHSVPNVPTVSLRVAGALSLAQLDTGYDDALVPHAINVNEAFLDAIVTSDPTALVRDATLDLSLTTCIAGTRERIEAYRLSPGYAAELMAEGGAVARSEPSAVLFVKRPPPAVRACGGIGTWRVPAAQLAASFFVSAGVVVFDPAGERVWLPLSRD